MKISEVKKKFKNTWVLAEVLKQNKLNQATDIKPILARKDPNKLYSHIKDIPKDKTSYIFFTGEFKGEFLF